MTNDFTDTNAFVIVGCGSAKQDTPAEAQHLYTSTYFAKKREYAVEFGDNWRVISAEHGLIKPDTIIEPYDTHITDLTEDELDALAHTVGITLIDWIAETIAANAPVSEIIILAGRSYLDPLQERDTFSAGIEPTVTYPLQQNQLSGIGEQMSWINDRLNTCNSQSTLTEHL